MKTFRIWWPICLLLLVVTACNKDESTEGKDGNNNGAFYIRCKIDGTAKTFNFSPNASKQDLGSGTFSYSIFGKAAQDANNFESFGISMQIAGDLTAGTYTDADSTASYVLVAVYNPNSTDQSKIYASNMDPANPFQITVSEITDSLMTGTFKGKMYLHTTDSTPPSVMATDGEFKVRVQ
jgi:hypothetical protein